MKKILFTSLLCASFAANVNLLPAPVTGKTSAESTEEQAAFVLQPEQDDAFLKAQNALVPLIKDLQSSGFCVYGPQNQSLVKVFESKEEIKSVGEVLFAGSGFGLLIAIDALVANLKKKPKKFATETLDLAKSLGWQDGAKENKSRSPLINKLFALCETLGAKKLNKDAVMSQRYQLENELKPVRAFWPYIGKLAYAEQEIIAKKIIVDWFTGLGRNLTTEEAELACDKLFAYMASSGGTIKEYSLSKALKSEDQQVKNLRRKLETGPDGKETKIKDFFGDFLNKTLDVSENTDVSKIFALTPYLDDKKLSGQMLVQIGYNGYALKVQQ